MKQELSDIFTSELADLRPEEMDNLIVPTLWALADKDAEDITLKVDKMSVNDIIGNIEYIEEYIRSRGNCYVPDSVNNLIIDHCVFDGSFDPRKAFNICIIMLAIGKVKLSKEE